MKTQLYNLKGESVGEVDLPDAIFATPWNPDLVHQVILAQDANQHHPWAHAKGRGEVRGGGKKPWKQKHTGRARHGSIRSPIWKGGGVSHGPTKERIFTQKVNKKMARVAVHSALSKKLADGEVRIVDSLEMSGKTKQFFASLKMLLGKNVSSLIVPAAKNLNAARAARNIPKVASLPATSLNVSDVLKHKTVVIDKNALVEIK
ncbi:MAG: large subunit ribosomal protein L4 [Parcubacteria group bacterium Gr01-1014_3]|nr:MAG: large subunit ribosomal protein L4 [Parcubacteria group bacterium Gr01-1014_3]